MDPAKFGFSDDYSDHVYQAKSLSNGLSAGHLLFLVTASTTFESPGLASVRATEGTPIKVDLDNGFSSEVTVLNEVEDDPSIDARILALETLSTKIRESESERHITPTDSENSVTTPKNNERYTTTPKRSTNIVDVAA